jgi:hypothetical protein
MLGDFHVDMSGRFYRKQTVGIACVGVQSKTHVGCILQKHLIRSVEKRLYSDDPKLDRAKLYSICIYLLIRRNLDKINTLVICNDENFDLVKACLHTILVAEKQPRFAIISISDLKKRVGFDIESLADNYAKHYRKRALNRNKWNIGVKLNIIEVKYKDIETYWEILEYQKYKM